MKKAEKFMRSHGMDAGRVDIEKYSEMFCGCMERGLDGPTDTVPMLLTYLRGDAQVPKGEKAAVIDAGGTNFRAALVSFEDDGFRLHGINRSLMPGTERPAEWEEFITHCVDSIEPFLGETDKIGVCFSYPMESTRTVDGRVLSMTKQVKVLGASGKLIGESITGELGKRGVHGKRIVVLNDTPATLLGGLAGLDRSEYGGFIGLVVGTGVNTACMLPENGIKKLPSGSDRKMLINVESGSFNGFTQGDFDRAMDAALPDTGCYTGEKMCSGAYFGELCRYTLVGAAKEGLFSQPAAEYFEGLKRLETYEADAFGMGRLPDFFSETDARRTVYIVSELYSRSSRCMSSILSGMLKLTGEGKEKPVCIAVDGSLFKKSNLFREKLVEDMNAYAAKKLGRKFEFKTCEETSLLGAAAAALIN